MTPRDDPPPTDATLTDSDLSDHMAEARARARVVLGGEGHAVSSDDWRHGLLSARNGVVLLALIGVMLSGFGFDASPDGLGPLLVVGGVGLSVFLGISAGLVTHAELKHLEAELRRERHEIAVQPEHEREEVRALYAAKGFREPLLSQIVEVLCADDDRLLKVMMEEELGLFIHPTNHPIVVGLMNALCSLVACLILSVPVCFLGAAASTVWVPAAGAAALTALAVLMSRLTQQPAVPLVARWLLMAVSSAGVVHFLSRLASHRG